MNTLDRDPYINEYEFMLHGMQNSFLIFEDEINRWKQSKIAKSEPQAAYSAFTAGFQHKMTYFIRTIPDLAETLKPLDDCINNNLIPAITEGHVLSDAERKLISLPVRYGGLGIPIYSEICSKEFEYSRKLTQSLTSRIVAQESESLNDQVKEREIERER